MSQWSFAQLNWADYAIIGIMLVSVGVSILRGFMREACSLATWTLAAVLTIRFAPASSDWLITWIETPSLRMITAGIILFVLILIIGALSTYLIGQLVDLTGLSHTDRALGALFGAARGLLLVSVFILLGSLTTVTKDVWWTQSRLIAYFDPCVQLLQHLLPKDIAALSKHASAQLVRSRGTFL